MEAILLVLHVLLALTLISLVLLQHGKGAEVGASFGSGASSTVFGARGSASFLTKLTTIIAVIFFASSLALAYISARPARDRSLIDNMPVPAAADTEERTIVPIKVEQVQDESKVIEPVESDDVATGKQDPVPADVPVIEE